MSAELRPINRMHASRRQKKLAQVVERDGRKCWICGIRVDLAITEGKTRASLDHVVPLSDGGDHSLSNLRLAHTVCNLRRNRVHQALSEAERDGGQG